MDFSDLTKYLDSLGEKFIPARELIVTRNHEVIYSHFSGFSDARKTKPLTGNEIYLLFSSSKIATCIGALRLVEKGLIKLEDKVSDYIPEYKSLNVLEDGKLRPAKTDLLVKHLFTMCGGFTYNRDTDNLKRFKNDKNATSLDVVRAIAKEPLAFDPGAHFEYSLCHDILGGLIEAVSGKTLDRYLKDEIFIPLDMKDTTFNLNDEQRKRLAVHYVYNSESGSLKTSDNLNHIFKISPLYESGGAGIYSTTSDYAKFADAIACGGTAYNGYEVLKPETVELYAKNWLDETCIKDFQTKTGHLGNGYGLGCMVLMDKKPRNYKCTPGVFGWGGMAGTKVVMDLKNKLSFYYSQEVEGGVKRAYEEHQHNVITNMLYEILGLD